jgi:NUMOD4 motif
MEHWKEIRGFPGYSVSDYGRIQADKSGRILRQSENQYGLAQVGMMKNGEQKHRSVPLLVASAFMERPYEAFDTPINLDGDRHNNHVNNLLWRPRWFAVKYNRQFRYPYEYPIDAPIEDVKTGMVSENSFECCKDYGLLEEDLVLSILNRTYVWPTYQEFRIVGE